MNSVVPSWKKRRIKLWHETRCFLHVRIICLTLQERGEEKTTVPKSKCKGIYSEIVLQIFHMTVPMSWYPSVHSLATLFEGFWDTVACFSGCEIPAEELCKMQGSDRGCTEKGIAACTACWQPAHMCEWTSHKLPLDNLHSVTALTLIKEDNIWWQPAPISLPHQRQHSLKIFTDITPATPPLHNRQPALKCNHQLLQSKDILFPYILP